MGDMNRSRLLLMRSAYVALCFGIMFFQLLPTGTLPVRWPGPDLLMALTFAWALRRPEYVPALSVAAVMLLADLLFQRPPGLYAALIVIGAEQLKTRAGGLRDASFAGEWVAAGIVMIAVVLLNRLVLAILLVEQAPLLPTFVQLLATIAVYPVVVGVFHLMASVRRAAPGSDSSTGSRG